MHYITIRNGINNENYMEIESEEWVALIDHSILKVFVIYTIPFKIIENLYFINVLKNLQPNYNLLLQEHHTTNLLSKESICNEIKIKIILKKKKI